MNWHQIHAAQGSILRTLRYTKAARYSDMMRPTGMESDVFKFHLRNMVKTGFVEKLPDGLYTLTPGGKEFANNFDDAKLQVQKQPKLSVKMVIAKLDEQGNRVYLMQQRKRNPYLGYWGNIGGPVQWGEAAEDTAAKELLKQTGLRATCTVRSFYRIRDYEEASKELLEDKLFIIVEATDIQGELTNTWPGGFNKWMTLDELKKTEKHYKTVFDYMGSLSNGKTYMTKDLYYKKADY